jgi:hypothetical protein
MKALATTLVLLIAPLISHADYVAKNVIYGDERSYLFIHEMHKLVALKKNKDSDIERLAGRFRSVDNFDGKTCYISIKNSSYSIFALIENELNEPPIFYTKDKDGKFKEVDVNTLIFPCEKVD